MLASMHTYSHIMYIRAWLPARFLHVSCKILQNASFTCKNVQVLQGYSCKILDILVRFFLLDNTDHHFNSRDADVIRLLYTTLVWPILDYSSTITLWNPH